VSKQVSQEFQIPLGSRDLSYTWVVTSIVNHKQHEPLYDRHGNLRHGLTPRTDHYCVPQAVLDEWIEAPRAVIPWEDDDGIERDYVELMAEVLLKFDGLTAERSVRVLTPQEWMRDFRSMYTCLLDPLLC
jgi:hypothetical protein